MAPGYVGADVSDRPLLAFLLVATLTACGSRLSDAGASGAATRPGGASASTVSASPSPSPAGRTAPFPDLPVIVGTSRGDVYFALRGGAPAGPSLHVCDGTVTAITAYGRQAAITCASSLYLWDETRGISLIAKTDAQVAAFDGNSSLAYVEVGQSGGSAPIPTTRLVLRDVRTGASTLLDERYGVAFDLRRTGRGIAVWRPRNSLSFVRPDAEVGTWIVIDRKLVKWSQHRVIDGMKGWDLLESEPAGGSGGTTYVLWKTTGEQRLTPLDVANEKAVAITTDLRAVAWRPDLGPFEGSMVTYEGTRVVRSDVGRFSAYRVATSGDWVVGEEYSGAPSLTLTAYRISDGAFAAQPAIGFTAFALLGAKK